MLLLELTYNKADPSNMLATQISELKIELRLKARC